MRIKKISQTSGYVGTISNSYSTSNTDTYSSDYINNLVVDSIRTKNIFGNYKIINGWISGTIMRVNSINGNRMAFVKCKPSTTYTVSRSVITSTFRVGEYTSIPTMTSSNVDYTLPKTIVEDNNATTITYTTGSTAQYLIVHYGVIEDTNLNESLATIQVEEGNTATAYSPYQNLNPDLSDTGWVDLSYLLNTTNFSIRGATGPQARRIGNTVYWRGAVYCSTATNNKTGIILPSVPSQFLPEKETGGAGVHYNLGTPYKIFVSPIEGLRVNEGENIPTTADYQGYTLSDLGPYLVD